MCLSCNGILPLLRSFPCLPLKVLSATPPLLLLPPQSTYSFSESGTYVAPECPTVAEMLDHIRALPQVPAPEVFGLHENADITCDQNETYVMFSTVLALQPRVAGGKGLSREEQIEAAAKEILVKCPKPFDIERVQADYSTAYEESMNTVLAQECIRYNGLLVTVRSTLQESLKALKGLVVMSPELEAITDCIFDNKVPEAWANVAYPSLKPLSSWVVDLVERVKFIEGWIANGVPPAFWISGFFFPQARNALRESTRIRPVGFFRCGLQHGWKPGGGCSAARPRDGHLLLHPTTNAHLVLVRPPHFHTQAFLTGTLQNYARKNRFPIDTVSFDFVIRDDLEASTTAAPEIGCYIYGLYLEGARWDPAVHSLNESRPKELYTDFPMVWLKPVQHRVAPEGGIYMCPTYKTLLRAGTLSTTGHSTNFVMNVEVPSSKEQKHWIGRGVGLFCALMF